MHFIHYFLCLSLFVMDYMMHPCQAKKAPAQKAKTNAADPSF